MATTLCKTDLLTGYGEARYPLISDGTNLLVIKGTSAWSNKQLLATPKEEYYAQVVSYAAHSEYPLVFYNSTDALALQNRIGTLRDSLTVSNWISGHRPLFQYWARGKCPYLCKYCNTYDGYVSMSEKSMRYMEIAAVYKLLGFDLYNFPAGKASSFKAYFRIWNGSCLEWGTNYRVAQPSLHFGAENIYYRFSNSIHEPSFHRSSSEFGLNHGTISTSTRFNNGYSGNITDALYYDAWNAHDGIASNSPVDSHLCIYCNQNSSTRTNPYYTDIEITGDGLGQLKRCLRGGNRVWCHLGFSNNDAQSNDPSITGGSGQHPTTTLSIYCSRIELLLVVSWSRFNI